jgi:hypothetical protein
LNDVVVERGRRIDEYSITERYEHEYYHDHGQRVFLNVLRLLLLVHVAASFRQGPHVGPGVELLKESDCRLEVVDKDANLD